MDDKRAQAMAMIKAVYDDGTAEINEREYRFCKMVHKDRRKVFAFYTSIQQAVGNDDMSFLDTPEFERVEDVINNSVTFNDSLLSRIDGHWDKYPEDYLLFITTALGVISYPFFPASRTA